MTAPSRRRAPHILPVALCVLLSATACSRRAESRAASVALAEAPASTPPAGARSQGTALGGNASVASAPLDTGAGDRRVVRTAELSLEADSPGSVARTIEDLAQARGGFVLSADTGQSRTQDGEETTSVTVSFRVPVASFDGALNEVRQLGRRVSSEKVTGQDVTEEYVDVEAQLRARRAVEDQYLSILKDAKTIKDILEVEHVLGDVRTEIDRAEAHRRLLESESSLSTITVHVATHLDAIDTSGPGFGSSVREAAHDAAEVSVAIVNGSIRALGVLVPVGVLIGLPLGLLVRWVRRRRSRPALAA